ncbi:glycoside hydrolase superfamily [Podospora aff. communis PSN243]|uniref:Glycoside hydrolase superfamily n=1 Tax=Podospora aff. communis PSN243 TaxID=3040156 RepID=A0AAV9G557_9PEZI|nr:glycoside hydrolase superfamily [Podospora aff. communis PSN243]
MRLLHAVLALASLTYSSPTPNGETILHNPASKRAEWPYAPHVTSGRWIRDSTGKNVTYAGTNWPGHNDVMIPEGLQYQSIATIVTKIKSLGMNTVRLTFAIQMIDEIHANGGNDITIQKAFVQALGQTNGTRVLNQVLAKNPNLTASTTRLQVFDLVTAELAKQQIYIVLDNHISKGMWCCSGTDGNTFWGDTYFNAANWVRGLAYMANHAKSWPAVTALSLRNEPREPTNNAAARNAYNWQNWYTYMKQGSTAVTTANPDLLIVLSGLNYDTTITPVVQNTALTPGTGRYNKADFPANKIVLELHNYETGANNCNNLQGNLLRNGFNALSGTTPNVFPVMLTEFGFQMDASTWRNTYSTCLASFVTSQKAGWMIWVLAGSYYIRSGTQDYDEGWGLMNHDWSDWRSPNYVNGLLLSMVKGTLS